MQTTSEPRLVLVTLWLCELCLSGAGGECHVPGCTLWMNRAPDLPIHPEQFTAAAESGRAADTEGRQG